MITLSKKNDLAAYRQALAFITKEDVAHKLFTEMNQKYMSRDGGYTRIVRMGPARAMRPRWLLSSWFKKRERDPLPRLWQRVFCYTKA